MAAAASTAYERWIPEVTASDCLVIGTRSPTVIQRAWPSESR